MDSTHFLASLPGSNTSLHRGQHWLWLTLIRPSAADVAAMASLRSAICSSSLFIMSATNSRSPAAPVAVRDRAACSCCMLLAASSSWPCSGSNNNDDTKASTRSSTRQAADSTRMPVLSPNHSKPEGWRVCVVMRQGAVDRRGRLRVRPSKPSHLQLQTPLAGLLCSSPCLLDGSAQLVGLSRQTRQLLQNHMPWCQLQESLLARTSTKASHCVCCFWSDGPHLLCGCQLV